MTDPMSITASVAGIISLGLSVCQGLLRYYDSSKDYSDAVASMYAQLDGLTKTFGLLENTLSAQQDNLNAQIVNRVQASLDSCRYGVEKLDKKLCKVRRTSDESCRNKVWNYGRRVLWPFKESTVMKLKEIVVELRDDLDITIGILQIDVSATSLERAHVLNAKMNVLLDDSEKMLAGMKIIDQDVVTVNRNLSLIHLEEENRRLYQWLGPPDALANHTAARSKHEDLTNRWFICSDDFQQWRNDTKTLHWLYAIPGAGKTVLASSIIEQLMNEDSKIPLGYYYFDFNDRGKQNVRGLITSLLMQISFSNQNITPLLSLYCQCARGGRAATDDELSACFRSTVIRAQIVIDALDECVERDKLMLFIRNIMQDEGLQIRLLVTSRREGDINGALDPFASKKISVQSAVVDEDIQLYVRNRLQSIPRMARWCKDVQMKSEIECKLIEGSHGMFRWVMCQIDELQKCLTASALRKALKSLPRTLYETYDRILLGIDEVYQAQAIRAFQWLSLSQRPLYVEELVEALAILPPGPSQPPAFDPTDRFSDPEDLFSICLSLVTASATHPPQQWASRPPQVQVRLAHYSVKEYLFSDIIRSGPAASFWVGDVDGNASIAEACIAYILQIEGPVTAWPWPEGLPLAQYAASKWHLHAKAGQYSTRATHLHDLTIQLLSSNDSMAKVRRLSKPHYPEQSCTSKPALHWAAQYGLIKAAELLLKSGADPNVRDALGRTALHHAVKFRQERLIPQLVSQEIDINAEDEDVGAALDYAVHNEAVSAVRALLEGGADVNIKSSVRRTTLYLAAERGNETIVRLLVAHGADPNVRCPGWTHKEAVAEDPTRQPAISTALQIAAWRNYPCIVEILLGAGATVENGALLLLAEGKIDEGLRITQGDGTYPQLYGSSLPDYSRVIRALNDHVTARPIQ